MSWRLSEIRGDGQGVPRTRREPATGHAGEQWRRGRSVRGVELPDGEKVLADETVRTPTLVTP